MNSNRPVQTFSITYQGQTNVIMTQVDVSQAFIPQHQAIPPLRTYEAIWDTGATNTVISPKVVAECNLAPIDIVKCWGVAGEHEANVYLISLGLPNQMGIASLRVTEGNLRGADLLVGMDVINCGDFAITNHEGRTVMTFRTPSIECIDFTGKVPPVQSKPILALLPSANRNDPCPCGSGKKYKKCCLNKMSASPVAS